MIRQQTEQCWHQHAERSCEQEKTPEEEEEEEIEEEEGEGGSAPLRWQHQSESDKSKCNDPEGRRGKLIQAFSHLGHSKNSL